MAPASSPASPPTTASNRLAAPLAGRDDLETWVPEDPVTAQGAIAAVAGYCRDYCPARLSCPEEACRLYRLEQRSLEVIAPTPADRVGVIGQPILGL